MKTTGPYKYTCAFCFKDYYLIRDLLLHEKQEHFEGDTSKYEEWLGLPPEKDVTKQEE